MKNELFEVGGFRFLLKYPSELELPVMFRKFCLEKKAFGPMENENTGKRVPDFYYEICLTDVLPMPEGKLIAKRPDLDIYLTETGENRVLRIKGAETAYAYYEELPENQAVIWLTRSSVSDLYIDPFFVSLLALERHMLKRDQLVLHCAYMRYQGEAILFSAPSETGKTTQANLWKKYRGSTTINGDRGLLGIRKDQWTVMGWPVCGSSEVCEPLDTKIRAVVMLSQAKENRIEKLGPAQAVLQMFSQITVNRWNRESTVRAMERLEHLVSHVPVYHLGCDISEDAVKCLEEALYGTK